MVATGVRQAVAKAKLVPILNCMTITSIGRVPRKVNVPKGFPVPREEMWQKVDRQEVTTLQNTDREYRGGGKRQAKCSAIDRRMSSDRLRRALARSHRQRR